MRVVFWRWGGGLGLVKHRSHYAPWRWREGHVWNKGRGNGNIGWFWCHIRHCSMWWDMCLIEGCNFLGSSRGTLGSHARIAGLNRRSARTKEALGDRCHFCFGNRLDLLWGEIVVVEGISWPVLFEKTSRWWGPKTFLLICAWGTDGRLLTVRVLSFAPQFWQFATSGKTHTQFHYDPISSVFLRPPS